MSFVQGFHAPDMLHETRQILQIAPERIDLIASGIDRDTAVNANSLLISDGVIRSLLLVGSFYTQSPIKIAITCDATLDQSGTGERQPCTGDRVVLQCLPYAEVGEGTARDDRPEPFRLMNIPNGMMPVLNEFHLFPPQGFPRPEFRQDGTYSRAPL
jgi:hypothetical protein